MLGPSIKVTTWFQSISGESTQDRIKEVQRKGSLNSILKGPGREKHLLTEKRRVTVDNRQLKNQIIKYWWKTSYLIELNILK